MKYSGYIFLILLFIGTGTLSAQSGEGSRGGRFAELIGTAAPAENGRVITVGGRLTPYRKISHNINISGFVDAVLVRTGEKVDVGDPLLRITRETAGENYRPVILESRIEGRISDVHVVEKEQVSTGNPGVTILDDQIYLLAVSLSDRDAPAVRKLISREVTGVSPEGETYRGRIRELATEPDYENGLFKLTMEFPKHRTLLLGSVLFVDLPVQQASGVAIDSGALISEGGQTYLWVITEERSLEKRSVLPGAESEGSLEIKEGLQAGERYIRKPDGREEEGLSLRELMQAGGS